MDARHTELAKRIGLGHSERIAHLFDMIADDFETDLLLALPANTPALAEPLNRSEDELSEKLQDLFMRGLVFPSKKTDPPTFRMSRDVIQFHDATALWPGATIEYRNLWRDFMDEEWPEISKTLPEVFGRPINRVIPIGVTLEAKASVLAYEDVKEIIDNARTLAVTDCPCRLTHRKCDSPLEVCLQLDRTAEYNITRGYGRELTKEEALGVMRQAEEAGLVHMVVNQRSVDHIICSCCSCCCVTMPNVIRHGADLLAPSRFEARVDSELCTACETCLDRCIFSAVEMNEEQDLAVIDPGKCQGCGVCLVTCPTEAISLVEVRPREFIPEKMAH
ncbi:MAG: 4Fe-4S binding protein [Deltaproteobacteria bacterium]|nr:4Fe-4S binding protein [Deltaproteobacteria bacterium]